MAPKKHRQQDGAAQHRHRKPISIASDCSGWGTERVVMEQLRLKRRTTYLFASEKDPKVRRILEHNMPAVKQVFNDVRGRDVKSLQSATIYINGSPCTDFSPAGNRQGASTNDGQLLLEAVDYIQTCRPEAFILENSADITNRKHLPFFIEVLEFLESDGIYTIVIHKCNTLGFLPQNRPRTYVIGWQKKKQVQPFPDKIPVATLKTLDDILGPHTKELLSLSNPLMLRGGLRSERLCRGLLKIIDHDGEDPLEGDYFMDIEASPSRFGVTKEHCICLTQARCKRKSVFSTRLGRCLDTREMMLLQGFPEESMTCPHGVAERVFTGCIGNAMSVPVLGSCVRLVLISLGYIAKNSPNPWGK